MGGCCAVFTWCKQRIYRADEKDLVYKTKLSFKNPYHPSTDHKLQWNYLALPVQAPEDERWRVPNCSYRLYPGEDISDGNTCAEQPPS